MGQQYTPHTHFFSLSPRICTNHRSHPGTQKSRISTTSRTVFSPLIMSSLPMGQCLLQLTWGYVLPICHLPYGQVGGGLTIKVSVEPCPCNTIAWYIAHVFSNKRGQITYVKIPPNFVTFQKAGKRESLDCMQVIIFLHLHDDPFKTMDTPALGCSLRYS